MNTTLRLTKGVAAGGTRQSVLEVFGSSAAPYGSLSHFLPFTISFFRSLPQEEALPLELLIALAESKEALASITLDVELARAESDAAVKTAELETRSLSREVELVDQEVRNVLLISFHSIHIRHLHPSFTSSSSLSD